MLKILQDIGHHTLTRVILGIFIFALVGAFLVLIFEDNDNEQFTTIYDGVWWVLVTMTTVGYGDKVPMTTGGRMIGTIIMFSGVALLSVFTATVSSIIITRKLREGKGLQDIKFKGHLLICGWNFSVEQILTLLEKQKNELRQS